MLQYVPDLAEALATLGSFVRPGGVLSVICPNPAAMVLRQLVTQGPAPALAELRAESKRAVLFEHDVRKIHQADLEASLAAMGLPVVRRYGARIANDLLTDDAAKHDPDYFQELLELELALCDREPYLRIGGMYQVVGARP